MILAKIINLLRPRKMTPFAGFFDYARSVLFNNRVTQSQVDGMQDVITYWIDNHADKDVRWLAYIFATIYHETGRAMIPVREGFGDTDAQSRRIIGPRPYNKVGKFGFVPYGRGRVQVTWDDNYDRMERIFGYPFTKNPDLLLDSKIDAQIVVEGHIRGLFTGRRLEHYFNDVLEDPINARRIINRLDKAELIAGYYRRFLKALKAPARSGRSL